MSQGWLPEYIARIIKASEPIILGWVRATTADNFPIDNLKALEIRLPPPDKQNCIAAILDQADELRRLRQRAIDRLNDLGQAIFYEMFGDLAAGKHKWLEIPVRELALDEDGVKCGPFGRNSHNMNLLLPVRRSGASQA